ncbi:hypothetical protein [Flavobacterium sp.]|uniref:hypothetical protein n=1 Tax=Flavobacterium sp. TaxID=239 RepID=UPI0037513BAE
MKGITTSQKVLKIFLSASIFLSISVFSVFGQQMTKMKMDTPSANNGDMKVMQDQTMLPMPFFTHMGIPYSVGTYSLRVAALPTINDGKTNTEFNFQFETGLSKTVGLFIGGEGLFDSTTLEAMFQFLVWKSKNGRNGISPIIEFEFPLGKDATRSVYTLVGFASTFSTSNVAFNQVLHYSPLEDLAEGSASVLVKVSKRIFLVSEISGVTEKGAQPIFNLLAGVKFQLNKNILLGVAYQQPLTTNRDYDSQFVFQPNLFFQK